MIKSILTVLMLALVVSGCSSSSSNIPPAVALAAITVNPSSATVAPGTTKQFQAVAVYTNGNQVDATSSVTWSSSNPSVATVNSQGLVTAVGSGSAQIRASMGGFAGAATLNTAAIQSIALTPPAGVPIIAGSTNQQFTATATLSNGQSQDITNISNFSSSNTGVATIGSTTGQASFLTAGPTTISATAGGVTGTLPVTVLTMNTMDLQPTPASIGLGGTLPFTATGSLSNGATGVDVSPLVNFTSSNPAIATIGTNGALSAVGVGTTVVTAGFPGVASPSSTVTVVPPSSITVTPGSSTAVAGSTQQLTATGNFSSGSTTNLTPLVSWSSSSPGVATVNSQGVVTAVGNGTTQITASVPTPTGPVTGTTTLTVNSISSLAITPATPAVGIGSSVQLQAIGTFSDGSTQNLTSLANWQSLNPGVASVSNAPGAKGLVTGLSRGNAVITASYNGVAASSATVTVQQSVIVPANELFVTSFTSNFLSAIDAGSNAVLASVPIFSGPLGVAINPVTNLIYVAGNTSSNVSVVDATTNTVVTTIGVQAGPWGVAVDPTRNRIYVANNQAGTVSVIDGSSNIVIGTITVGGGPRNLVVNPGTHRLYVANFTANTVSVIDTISNSVVGTIGPSGLSGPVDVAISPVGSLLYIANSSTSTVSVASTTNNTILSTISLGAVGSPRALAVSPTLSQVYVAADNSVVIIDATSNSVIAAIPLPSGAAPRGIAVRSATGRIYVANNGNNTVSVVDPMSRTVTASIPVPAGPMDIATQ